MCMYVVRKPIIFEKLYRPRSTYVYTSRWRKRHRKPCLCDTVKWDAECTSKLHVMDVIITYDCLV